MNTKKIILHYLKREKALLLMSVVFALLFIISQISQPFLLGKVLDFAKENNNRGFYIYLSISLALSLIGTVFSYFFEYFIGVISQRTIKYLRDEVAEKINSISLKDFDKKHQGDLLQLEIRDMENIASGIFAVFKNLVQGIFTIIITIIMMFMVNWILALGVIVLTPLSILMSSFVASFNHKHFQKSAKLQADFSSLSTEYLHHLDAVQSLNYEEKANVEIDKINLVLQKEQRVALFSASWINPSTRLVNNTIYVLIGIAGIIMLPFDQKLGLVLATMSIGRLSSFLSYTTQYSKPFNEISSVIAEYEVAKFSFRRIIEFLELKDDIDQGKEEIDEIKSIAFDHLDFSYTKDKELIKDFSLNIKAGNKVAIVGPTGAGKTTLINLIMRFYEPTGGKLLINGVNAQDISKQSLRNNIGMVLQETWIFNGTILDNIRYTKKDASLEEVKEAARKSHADSFIDSLPNGYETVISNKEGLSEGQKQMIAIARVMLLNPILVILDEATSNIDTRSEQLINQAFDTMMKDKTSIVIAHRLSTIRQADVIIVLKDGHIVEHGSHQELMKNKSLYYEMHASQFK